MTSTNIYFKIRNMKILSFLLILLSASFFATPVFAQENNTGKISGQIINNNHTPAAFATVTLLKEPGSTLVKGAISDTSGKYHFEKIPFGKYIIAVSVTGMNKVYTQPFSLIHSDDEMTIPAITLVSGTELLKDVKIKAIIIFIQQNNFRFFKILGEV